MLGFYSEPLGLETIRTHILGPPIQFICYDLSTFAPALTHHRPQPSKGKSFEHIYFLECKPDYVTL